MSDPNDITRTDSARSNSLRTTALATITVMLVVMGFALLLSTRNVLVGIFLGLLLATALRPVMTKLREGRLPSFVSASFAMLLMIGLIIAFLVVLLPLIADQVDILLRTAPGLYADMRERLTSSRLLLLRQIGYRLDPTLGVTDENEIATVGELLVPHLPTIGYLSFVLICTLVFTYYWLLYRERSIRGLLLLLPMEHRANIETIWIQIESRIGAFLRGQTLLALMTAVFSLIGYWLIGIPFPLLLAMIGGVLEFVPFLGPFIATGIAVTVGLSISPSTALAALLVGLVIQQVQNIFFAPRIMDRAVGISPVVTLLAFVGFVALLGPIGSLLAIPLAASLQVIFTSWVGRATTPSEDAPNGRSMADRLRYELRGLAADIASYLRQKDAAANAAADETEEALEQLLQDLDSMLSDEGDELPSGLPPDLPVATQSSAPAR